MVDPTELLAGAFVGSRSVDRLNDGEAWHRDGASAIARDGSNACGGSRFRIHSGHCQSPGVPSPQDRLTKDASCPIAQPRATEEKMGANISGQIAKLRAGQVPSGLQITL